jgi:hypothetical protein
MKLRILLAGEPAWAQASDTEKPLMYTYASGSHRLDRGDLLLETNRIRSAGTTRAHAALPHPRPCSKPTGYDPQEQHSGRRRAHRGRLSLRVRVLGPNRQ